MELQRIQELAGIVTHEKIDESFINEVVDVSEITDLEDAARRLQACKRALGIANSLPDEHGRQKWKRAALVNLNKVRGALSRIAKELETTPPTE